MAESTIVLITGGNTGLGYESVKALYGSPKGPYTIFLGGRSIEKVHAAIARLKNEIPDSASSLLPLQVDIESDESIAAAFENVKSRVSHIDVLINNAGAIFDNEIDETPASIRAGMIKTYNVNVASTQVMTVVFEPLLLKSANPRLLFVTSGLSSFTTAAAGLNRPNTMAYRTSKTALNMLMWEWCVRLKDSPAKIWCISPGLLSTGLLGALIGNDDVESMRQIGAEGPEAGGVFVKDVVEGIRDNEVGKVVDRAGVQPW
ncbi:NAD(P)-binding protein [Mytilinidion resinicola]|uniref:NAD(P)-binding protein n=1 Tax=Mytilinidion resinicola TaxID=574789 RepID=A0A6A6YYB9_9PEZI|nr:NAD(P)-binding protein [Mytilinidion resinicola]KAF2812994.1 NAD(P)-binding protein [Mytilinidion resinicola]